MYVVLYHNHAFPLIMVTAAGTVSVGAPWTGVSPLLGIFVVPAPPPPPPHPTNIRVSTLEAMNRLLRNFVYILLTLSWCCIKALDKGRKSFASAMPSPMDWWWAVFRRFRCHRAMPLRPVTLRPWAFARGCLCQFCLLGIGDIGWIWTRICDAVHIIGVT